MADHFYAVVANRTTGQVVEIYDWTGGHLDGWTAERNPETLTTQGGRLLTAMAKICVDKRGQARSPDPLDAYDLVKAVSLVYNEVLFVDALEQSEVSGDTSVVTAVDPYLPANSERPNCSVSALSTEALAALLVATGGGGVFRREWKRRVGQFSLEGHDETTKVAHQIVYGETA